MSIFLCAKPTRLVPAACLLLVLLFTGPQALAVSAFKAVVIRVQDGDSLMVRSLDKGARELRLRLYGIDAPELRQKDGKTARDVLQNLLPEGSVVEITPKGRDSYHRTVALVHQDNRLINLEMVRKGAAWVYEKHCTEAICVALKAAEDEAQGARTGLWRRKAPLPPWTWRERTR